MDRKPTKARPQPLPESQPFWDGAANGELRIQRCSETGKCFFPPRTYSPFVTAGAADWITATGRARLLSYTITHRPAPGFEGEAPYAIAIVELEEGARMMTNIVGVENSPEALALDMPLVVRFQEREGYMLPVFAPAGSAA